MAIDYLLGSWDHIQNPTTGHNFYLYKKKDGKWIYLSYDFDLDFGIPREKDINVPFNKYIEKKNSLIDVLILKNPSRFEKILKNVVKNVFNPATIYPHIDELKKFIRPLIKYDKTPDANGKYPGRLNSYGTDFYSLEEWDANSEFTRVKTRYIYTYGLKYWALYRYRYVCNHYQMSCDSTYMDKNFSYTINRNVEYKDNLTTPTSNKSIPTSSSTKQSIHCWSELINYECCSPKLTNVYHRNEYGEWSYDYTNKKWCGLTPFKEQTPDKVCWSKKYGYPCCKSCIVYHKDNYGSWGYEFNQWCGIPSYCEN